MQGIYTFITSLLYVSLASAHPVTFQGGTMVKSMVREDMSETSATYSFTPRLAAGLGVDRWLLEDERDTSWGFAEFNVLLKRWNRDHAQGNVYLLTGAGQMWERESSHGALKWGLQADYETREFYTALTYGEWLTEDLQTRYTVYRVGMAPFVAGYKDLSVWGILQLDYNKDMRKNVQVTPFLRFFYRNVFWEAGASWRGNFYGQFMIHF